MVKKTNFLVLIAAAITAACSSTEPEQVSGVHLDAVDRATRPQDDFYQFVNGGWLDSTEIPEIYSGYTVYHEVNERVEIALREIIESAADSPGEKGSESQQVGDIYGSWMNVESINAAGVAPAQSELDLVATIDSVNSLVGAMAELSRLGVMVPYANYVEPDREDSSSNTLYFYQRGITMPNRDYYLQPDNENFTRARSELTPYIGKMLLRSGLDKSAANAAAERVFDLETAIATAQWDSVSRRDPIKTYNPYSMEGLGALGNSLNWELTLKILGVEGQDRIVIEQPSYFEALNSMLSTIPLATWRHYLTFRVMDSRALHLDEATAAIRFDYRYRILRGQKEQHPRWKLGVNVVNGLIGEAVGKLYVAEYFPPEAKSKMEELVNNVVETLDASIEDLEWMSEETRVKAKEKLAKFTPKIGYPNEWKDYSALDIGAGDHYGNVTRAIEWEHQRELAKLGRPVDNKEWFMTPQTVNAYYDPSKNEIVFPAARLQPPFFQLNADDAINYGAVGGVIGHEISHGFDDSGSQFDGDGNLVDWWTDEDRAAFDERTSVLVAQFNAFEPVEGMHINGELTLGENIGDLSGVAMAYRAYINSLNGEEPPVIDGFTGPQRFFIGYAMSRKGKYQEASSVSRLASDPHSPLEYRVNGPYPNIDAFHEAFGTQEGDGMWLPPDERVRIW